MDSFHCFVIKCLGITTQSHALFFMTVEIIQDIDVPERTKASFGPTVWQFPMTELNFAEFLFANVSKTQPVMEE